MTQPSTLDISLTGVRTIGVLSDTHIPHRLARMPETVFAGLAGCDIILHAGDLEDPSILRALGAISPVYAVRGNLHWQFSTGTHDQELPLAITVRLGAQVIWLTHGHFSFAYSLIDKFSGYATGRKHQGVNDLLIERLRRMRPPDATAVVFGHSHLSVAREVDGVMYFNPGSVAAQERKFKEGPRIGRLTIEDDGALTPSWVDLD